MREKVFNYMKEFGAITTYDAFVDLGCSRLSEYIRQLRLEYKVADEWIKTINRYGRPIKYKKYWLED